MTILNSNFVYKSFIRYPIYDLYVFTFFVSRTKFPYRLDLLFSYLFIKFILINSIN